MLNQNVLNHNEEFVNFSELSVNTKLLSSRIIVLSESIHSRSAKRVIQELLSLEAQDPYKPITLFLNSPGGEVSSGFGIYDTVRFIQPEVKIVVTGLAASIATIIFLSARKENRYSLPNSRLLIHQPLISGTFQGQASDIEIQAKEILRTREKLVEIYHSETKQPISQIEKDIERDYWMTAKEALDYGLVTKIIESRAELV